MNAPPRSQRPLLLILTLTALALFLGIALGASCRQDPASSGGGDQAESPAAGAGQEQRIAALEARLEKFHETSTRNFAFLVLGLFITFLLSVTGLFLLLRMSRGRDPWPGLFGGPKERSAAERDKRIGSPAGRTADDMWSPPPAEGADLESPAENLLAAGGRQRSAPPSRARPPESAAGESPPLGRGTASDGAHRGVPPPRGPQAAAAPPRPAAPPRQPDAASGARRPASGAARPAPTEAELAALPHGEIAVVLLGLHRAAPELAQGFLGVDHRTAAQQQLGERLLERLERFRKAVHAPSEVSLDEWVDYDLVAILDDLARLLSTAIEERRRGRGARQRVEADLQRWLYDRLAPICRDQGWFEVEPILPYSTAFNPRIHNSIGSRPVDGAENLVIEIRSIGRRSPRTGDVVQLAEVVVGC